MSRKYLQELIKILQEFYDCPSCGAGYRFDDIKVLGQVEKYCIVQLSCHACSLPVVTTASVDAKGPMVRRKPDKIAKSKPAYRTGRRYGDKEPITAIEIAEFHQFIREHDGPIGKLL